MLLKAVTIALRAVGPIAAFDGNDRDGAWKAPQRCGRITTQSSQRKDRTMHNTRNDLAAKVRNAASTCSMVGLPARSTCTCRPSRRTGTSRGRASSPCTSCSTSSARSSRITSTIWRSASSHSAASPTALSRRWVSARSSIRIRSTSARGWPRRCACGRVCRVRQVGAQGDRRNRQGGRCRYQRSVHGYFARHRQEPVVPGSAPSGGALGR